MKVSIVVITFNEVLNIRECLDSIYQMDYPINDFEVIVVDGDSKDQTIEIVHDFQKKYSNLKLIIEKGKGAALARKVGVERARYDYLAFTDADCIVPKNWLLTLVRGFVRYSKIDPSLVAVGGRNQGPSDGNLFLQSMTIALNTFIGSLGSIQGSLYSKDLEVNSLATLNVLYDRKKILAVGNFDERLLSYGEDADINFRLKLRGYSFYYLADSTVFHKYRPTLKLWLINMVRYGQARAKLLKKHQEMWSILYILPILFLLSFLALPLSIFNKIFLIPLLYFPLIILYSLLLATKAKKPQYFISIFNIFFITHFGYAHGMVRELLKR